MSKMLTPPIRACVRIDWEKSTEEVPIYPGQETVGCLQTLEWLVRPNRQRKYQPDHTFEKTENEIKHQLIYSSDNENYIEDGGIVDWGTSTITITDLDGTDPKVHVRWKSASGYTFEPSAQLIDKAERVRGLARPIMRNQTHLRKLLLKSDGCCALTGEKTEAALECAHIVAVKNDGVEVDDNAILLRADLHCLYDAGKFDISTDGAVINVSDDLSQDYQNLLKLRRLPASVSSRVRSSLIRRKSASL